MWAAAKAQSESAAARLMHRSAANFRSARIDWKLARQAGTPDNLANQSPAKSSARRTSVAIDAPVAPFGPYGFSAVR